MGTTRSPKASPRKLPDAAGFLHYYPDYDTYTGSDVWRLIGGSLDATYGPDSPSGTQNSCAARASYALNRCGCPIPRGTSGANRNWSGDNRRYIISARQMNAYLRLAYGPPARMLQDAVQLALLRHELGDGGAAIVSSTGHVAVVTQTYADRYVSHYLGDVWIFSTLQ